MLMIGITTFIIRVAQSFVDSYTLRYASCYELHAAIRYSRLNTETLGNFKKLGTCAIIILVSLTHVALTLVYLETVAMISGIAWTSGQHTGQFKPRPCLQ